jgi:hypothetical protein
VTFHFVAISIFVIRCEKLPMRKKSGKMLSIVRPGFAALRLELYLEKAFVASCSFFSRDQRERV